jgi:hypothetical protein
MDDDRNAPASKADLAELETRITEALTEVVRDGQTEILKAFYGFTETVQTRFKAQDDTEAGLKKRLTVLEERLLEVEKRLNMPPAA